MAQSKVYSLIFIGDEAEKAAESISTYFIDGGGEDMVIEKLFLEDIKAERIYWSKHQMAFQVSKIKN